jgi:hypothetical protein
MVNARQPSRQNFPLLIFKGNSADQKILGFNDYRDRSVDFQSFPREQFGRLGGEKTVSLCGNNRQQHHLSGFAMQL